jgi:hypothetical protein
MDIGLMPNKSQRIRSLKIPDNLFFDFLRGHMDGDGTILRYQDPIYPTSTRLYLRFMSASKPHILWLKREIKRLLGIDGFIRPHPSKVHPNAYTLTFSKCNSIELLNNMYKADDSPRLNRKFNIIKDFVSTPR